MSINELMRHRFKYTTRCMNIIQVIFTLSYHRCDMGIIELAIFFFNLIICEKI